MFISNRYSVTIVRQRRIVHRAALFTQFLRIDRWAGLAHAPQMCCFSSVLGVLSLFKVHNYWWIFVFPVTWLGIFLDVTHEQARYDSTGQVEEGLTILLYPGEFRNTGLSTQKKYIRRAYAQVRQRLHGTGRGDVHDSTVPLEGSVIKG